MRSNGSGHHNDNETERGRPTFEEALAAIEPRDRLDEFALFVARQLHTLGGAIDLIGRRLDALECDVEKLKAERGGHSSTTPWRN
jgi:hypothetical protein